jgi:hypothetical protein
MVFENRVLRRVFASNSQEIKFAWRKFNQEVQNLPSSPNIITMMK